MDWIILKWFPHIPAFAQRHWWDHICVKKGCAPSRLPIFEPTAEVHWMHWMNSSWDDLDCHVVSPRSHPNWDLWLYSWWFVMIQWWFSDDSVIYELRVQWAPNFPANLYERLEWFSHRAGLAVHLGPATLRSAGSWRNSGWARLAGTFMAF